MATQTTDIPSPLQASEALVAAAAALQAANFTITSTGPRSFRAERGSGTKRALLGGLADRSILSVAAFDSGQFRGVRVEMAASGWSGGVLGARRAGKAYDDAVQRVAAAVGAAPVAGPSPSA